MKSESGRRENFFVKDKNHSLFTFLLGASYMQRMSELEFLALEKKT